MARNQFTFRASDAKNPAEIDLTRRPDARDPADDGKPRVVLGIYELKVDTLKVCLGLEGQKRPTELKLRGLPRVEYMDPVKGVVKYPDGLLVLKRAPAAKWEKLPEIPDQPPPATKPLPTKQALKTMEEYAGNWVSAPTIDKALGHAGPNRGGFLVPLDIEIRIDETLDEKYLAELREDDDPHMSGHRMIATGRFRRNEQNEVCRPP